MAPVLRQEAFICTALGDPRGVKDAAEASVPNSVTESF